MVVITRVSWIPSTNGFCFCFRCFLFKEREELNINSERNFRLWSEEDLSETCLVLSSKVKRHRGSDFKDNSIVKRERVYDEILPKFINIKRRN